MIKAVFLDIDNTLLDFNRSSAQAIERAFNKHNLPYNQKVYTSFLEINAGLWQRIERGDFTRQQLHAQRWNIILGALGLEYDGVKIETDFRAYLNECAILIDGALDLVKYLSKKYYLCTASNAPHSQQLHRLDISNLRPYINQTFTSEDLKADKPSREFFDKCFSRLEGISPQQTIIIGDSLTADISGGRDYGMQTIWFNFENKPLPQDKIYDYVVNTLVEIKNIL